MSALHLARKAQAVYTGLTGGGTRPYDPVVALKLCLVAAAVALLLFVGTVGSRFVWDDELLFRSWLPYFDRVGAILSPPRGIPFFLYHYYRPVLITSYWVDEQLASATFPPQERERGRRFFFHLTPVLLHAACTVLVFTLGMLLLQGASKGGAGKEAWSVFAGALLFAVHPVHVESVAWIVGRSDSLCALFGLGALITFLRWRERPRWPYLAAATSLLLLAVLSKEIGFGLLLPLVVIALSWPDRQTRARTAAPRTAEVLALLAFFTLYAALRLSSRAQMHTSVVTEGALPRLLGALGWYAVKSVWPFPQTAFPAEELRTGYVLVGLVAVGLVGAAFVFWRTRPFRAERVLLALAVGALSISLSVAISKVSTSPVAERNLYLPSAGACMLLAFLAQRLLRRRTPPSVPWVAVIACTLAIPSAWAVSRRLPVWDNPVLFWQEATASAPRTPVTHINLGTALMAAGRFPEAERAFEEALRLSPAHDPSSTMARGNLGSCQLVQGKLDDAIRSFEAALADDPRDATSLFNWASALSKKAHQRPASPERAALLALAAEKLRAALVIHPNYARAHLLLGTILLEAGETERARKELAAAASFDPGSPEGKRARELLAGAPFTAR